VAGDGIELCYADEGIALALRGSITACVFRNPITMERLQRLRRESVTIQARLGVARVNLTIIEPTAVATMAEDVRKESAALMRDFPAATTATVLEGGGFRTAAARAILSGLTLLAGERSRRRIFDSVEDAATWLAERNSARAPELHAPAVAALVEHTRNAMGLK
jgi:hypothetical protein